MKILHVNMTRKTISFEPLSEALLAVGGCGLIAKIMNREVIPYSDPLGEGNRLIIAGGPLAGTLAPQLGRCSAGGLSPLTLGIKEANAGGPAAQKLDKLGIRAIIIEGMPVDKQWYYLLITKNEAALVPGNGYQGMNNYELVAELRNKYGNNVTVISIGIAGERQYKAASIAFTDIYGDPSRNAARGGLGAVMGSKRIKAIIIDDAGMPPVTLAHPDRFRQIVKDWVAVMHSDPACALMSLGTPHAVLSNSYQGTMPTNNYSSGRAAAFYDVSGEIVRRNIRQRGGKTHACMPGCVVQCSMTYNDITGRRICSAYEYEAIAMLGTNLGITNPDIIARLKLWCDDIGLDLIETGSALAVAASAGKMTFGDGESAMRLLGEIEQGTDFGNILGNGVVDTARALNISRIPAYKGQAIPGHDPRAVKGVGVTYATSPMGADHTAGLTYRMPRQKEGQIANSLRFQIQAATCDTFGYCTNALPGRQASLNQFLADLMNARYGMNLTPADILETGKGTLKDELKFNETAKFGKVNEPFPPFFRKEALPPTNSVFDVAEAELKKIWNGLDGFKEPRRIWETRFPVLPSILFGVGIVQAAGEQAARLKMSRPLLIADPAMIKNECADRVKNILKSQDLDCEVISTAGSDPSVEDIENMAKYYRETRCDGLIGMGGGSSMDSAKLTALRVSQPGILEEYGASFGGTAKIRPPLPPLICIPTTSGTGSEVNQIAMLSDKKRQVKITIMGDFIIPRVAIIDPSLGITMPPGLTAETGVDALTHCIESFVTLNVPYHPFYDAMALHGIRLIGHSLRVAWANGQDLEARTDMCMAAAFGGTVISRGLGLGHAVSHTLGARYHIPHGRGCALGILCFLRANRTACRKQFTEMAQMLDHTDLEIAVINLFTDLKMPVTLRDIGIERGDLKSLAFEISLDAVNLASNPVSLREGQILHLLEEYY